jgi:hypothetical protein
VDRPPSGSDCSQYREGRPVTGSGRLARVQPGKWQPSLPDPLAGEADSLMASCTLSSPSYQAT